MNNENMSSIPVGELADDELLEVNGGMKGIKLMRVACVNCGRHFNFNAKKAKAKCPHCKVFNEFAG